MNEDVLKEFKGLREEAMVILGEISDLPLFTGSRLAMQHLMQGRMLIGRLLQDIEKKNPYPKGNDPNTEEVEKSLDLRFDEKVSDEVDSYVIKLKKLRLRIKKITVLIDEKHSVLHGYNGFLSVIAHQFEMAELWLGWGLADVHMASEPDEKLKKVLDKLK